jgi:protein tyrosine phosphatase
MPNLLLRKIAISGVDDDTQTRNLVHLQYLAWPDYGSPEPQDFKIIAKLLEYMRDTHSR